MERTAGLLGDARSVRLADRVSSHADAIFNSILTRPRAELALLPTPIQPLRRLSRELGAGVDIWLKRDDLTGLAGGGNKTRKLEFLVGEALEQGADTLVSVGAIQSNHTRQTAAAAARVGLRAVLLHNAWSTPPGDVYEQVGNPLLSTLMGATLLRDPSQRIIGDDGQLDQLGARLEAEGRRPYLIPGGASEHRLGGLGYLVAAKEIVEQAQQLGVHFDAIVHCTGSSSTQAGLIAGLSLLDSSIEVIGVADDFETTEKHERVLRLARETLAEVGSKAEVDEGQVEIIASDQSPYGEASPETISAICELARLEGLIADPVYEGKALLGLRHLIENGRLVPGQRVLLMHLGGSPAVHAYKDRLPSVSFTPL